MSSSRSGKMLEVNPPKYPTPFNQQATNRVLKQLQIQVMDVEAIILKLKNSLGINKNASERLEISPINTSEVDLSMSSQAGESIVQVELTYSDTPGTKSRMMSEYIQTRPANLSPPRNILKKLVYEQSESIVEQDKEQTKMNISYDQFAPPIINHFNPHQNLTLKNRQPSPKTTQPKENISASKQYDQYHITINKEAYNEQNQQIQELQHEQEQEQSISKKVSNFKHHYPMKSDDYQATKLKPLSKQDSPGLRSMPIHQVKQSERSKLSENKKSYQPKNSSKWNTQSRIDRLKVQKQRFQKYFAAIKPSYDSKTRLETVKQNTCAKNQLQNILVMNYHTRKSQEKLNSAEKKEKSGEKPGKSHQKNVQSPKKRNKSKILEDEKKAKSPIRSPFKSTNKSAKLSPLKTASKQSTKHSPITVKSKPAYIQKFINKINTEKSISKQPKSRSESPILQNTNPYKYSHPRKSPNKAKCSALELRDHKRSSCEGLNRQKFVQKMLEQCYVRRFLTQPELCKIYQQFCNHKVPRYQWEEKVIEKIFKKIHQFDQII